jgi:hypothetical protein
MYEPIYIDGKELEVGDYVIVNVNNTKLDKCHRTRYWDKYKLDTINRKQREFKVSKIGGYVTRVNFGTGRVSIKFWKTNKPKSYKVNKILEIRRKPMSNCKNPYE